MSTPPDNAVIGPAPDAGSRDYRTFMRSERPDLTLPVVEDQFLTWLRSKGVDLRSSVDSKARSEGIDASITHHARGHEEYIRCCLVESGTGWGTWRTDVLASSEGWIDLAVTNSEGRLVDVPRLARYLMQTLDLRDAALQLTDEVKQWDVNELDLLVELLEDQDRHGLVFVAGTGHEPDLYDAFRKRVHIWTREVFGLAQCIVLTPRATQLLEERLGHHAVGPWMLRTYYPGVNPARAVESRRHRFLTTATLATEKDGRLRQRLADIARRHAATRLDPAEVVRARRTFARLDTRALLTAIDAPEPTEAETPAPELLPSAAAAPERTGAGTGATEKHAPDVVRSETARIVALEGQLELVRSALDIDVITSKNVERAIRARVARQETGDARGEALRAAGRRIKEQLGRIEVLEDFQREARRALDDQELERADLQDELERVRAEVRWLRDQFKAASDYGTAFGEAPAEYATTYPSSCGELLDRLMEQDVLVFTGDASKAKAVDDADTMKLAVHSAWEACIALQEYVRARDDGACPGGVDHFLKNRPQGYEGVSPGKHGATETKATMAQFGDERFFPVPRDVAPNGSVAMKAHFKLASIGMLSPRMHYYDDYANTGRIYIGYLGRHLTNTMTN